MDTDKMHNMAKELWSDWWKASWESKGAVALPLGLVTVGLFFAISFAHFMGDEVPDA